MNKDQQTPARPAAQAAPSSGRRPPGPRGHPLWGSMGAFRRDQLGFITRVARDYGDVVRYRLANRTFYQVNHPEGVQRILQSHHHNYIKGWLFDPIRYVAGNGLFVSEGAHWLRQRRLMQPSFHHRQVAAFGTLMTDAAERNLEGWQQAAKSGSPIDIHREMTHLTLAIVTRALFGQAVHDEDDRIGEAITTLIEDIGYRFEVPFYPSPRVPTPRNLRMRAAQRVMDRSVYGLIEARRRPGAAEAQDLLAMLMAARDEETGETMSDSQLRDEVLTLYVAGHETTAQALTWCFYLLSQHPQSRRRLEAELDQALGGQVPTTADLGALPYTRMVVEEALRLYPPAWITSRLTVEPDEICGFAIPANAVVAVSPYVMQRHPAYWPNPEGFDPERFEPSRSQGRPRYAYFPFGGGPHQCIGNQFALVEAQLILATVAQRYRLDLAPGYPVVPQALTTLRPAHGMWMRALPVAGGRL